MGKFTDLPIWRFSAEQHTIIRDHADKVRADGSEVSKTILSLFATVVELAETALLIMQHNKVAGVKAIERSMLEAFIDLTILTKDGSYRNNMEAAYHKQRLKLINAGITGNIFLQGFDKNGMVAQRKAESEARQRELKDADYLKLTVEERFKRADFSDAYNSIYGSLCSETHNDLGALVKRHVRTNDDGGIEFHLYQSPDENDQILMLDSLAGIECDTNLLTHSFFKSEHVVTFTGIKAKLQDLRSQYPK